MARKRVALIGLGRMGGVLAKAIRAEGGEIVAAFDSAPDPISLCRDPTLAAVFTNDVGTFWSNDIEVLVVATTANSHIAYLKDGLHQGVRRFLIEKPLGNCLANAKEAIALARRLDARVIVNHGRRYSPNYRVAKEFSGTPEMGELRAISVTLGAAGLAMVGLHYLDLLVHLFGASPSAVAALRSRQNEPNPRGPRFEDPGHCAFLAWSDGRRALLDASDDTALRPLLELRYAKGRLLIPDENQPWQVVRRAAEARDAPLHCYGAPTEGFPLPGFLPFGIEDMARAAFRDATADTPPISSGDSALAAMEVFVAVREAGETGDMVHLPPSAKFQHMNFPIP